MSTLLMGLLAETFIHVGSEQSEGVVDLPVAREAITDYPFIPGSGLKGALRDWARQKDIADTGTLFGKQDNAGKLLFADARLLALPVRSLHGASRWVTCPHLIERFARDRTRLALGALDVPQVEHGKALGAIDGRIILEERSFEGSGRVPDGIVHALAALLPHAATQRRLAESLLVLHDEDFAWFASYGLAVQARNVLDEEKKTSKNLWYEESLPPDALLYATISERQSDMLAPLSEALKTQPYLQVGGNETIGQGWFALSFAEETA